MRISHPIYREKYLTQVVREVFVISAAHLRPAHYAALDTYPTLHPNKIDVREDGTYGWLIEFPGDDDDLITDEWPPELWPIVDFARDRGYSYLLFCPHTAAFDGLPTFDEEWR